MRQSSVLSLDRLFKALEGILHFFAADESQVVVGAFFKENQARIFPRGRRESFTVAVGDDPVASAVEKING